MKLLSAFAACAIVAISLVLPEVADAHAFLLLPKAEFVTSEKNKYAYTVPDDKAPPASSYTTGDAERNSQGFKANYKKLNPASLKAFIMANQAPAQGSGIPSGGSAECGLSKPDISPQPLPDHIEFGNYNLQNKEGIHPGPCEAWCDNEIVVPFTEDCRTILNKPITYDKAKCQGKKRLTFYWLATHFPPFQVYTDCVPLQGGGSSGGGGNSIATVGGSTQAGNRNGGSSVGSEAAPAPATSTTKNGGSGTTGTSGNAGTHAGSNTNAGTGTATATNGGANMWNNMGSSSNNNNGGWNWGNVGGNTNNLRSRSADGTETSTVGKVMPFPGWQ